MRKPGYDEKCCVGSASGRNTAQGGHPQFTGFILITLGMILEWATLPLLIMWPILGLLYFRLAKKEEEDMELEFGRAYDDYRRKTSMFIPLPRLAQSNPVKTDS